MTRSTTMAQILSHLASPQGGGTSGAAISKATRIGADSLYPALTALEHDGLVVPEWADMPPPRRRLYRLTDAGRQQVGAMPPLDRPATASAGNWFWRKLVAPLFGG